MTTFQRHMVPFILIAAVVSSFAGCAKPGEGRNMIVPTPAPAAAGAGRESAEDAASKRAKSLEAAAKLFKEDGARAAAPAAPVVVADASTVPPVGGATIDAASLPPADAAWVPASAPAAAPSAPAATASAPSVDEARRLEFTLAAVEPVMRLNTAIYLQRFEIDRIRQKLNRKEELTSSETDWLLKTKENYKLGASDSFDDLLARVDGVKMAFLIAPFAVATDWKIQPPGDFAASAADRIELLNKSASDENVRFRAARYDKSAVLAESESVAQMLAFQGFEAGSPAASNALVAAVIEINRLSQDPAVTARIQQVQQLILSESTKK